MIHLRQCKPATIEELKMVVKDILRTVPVDMIRSCRCLEKMSSVHPGTILKPSSNSYHPCIY